MSIGTRIKTIRKALDYSQEYLAEQVNISRVFVQSIEVGRRNPSMKTLKKFAKVLGVQIQDLLRDYSDEEKAARIQLESFFSSEENIELWYKKRKLSPSTRNKLYKIIQAVLDDDDKDENK